MKQQRKVTQTSKTKNAECVCASAHVFTDWLPEWTLFFSISCIIGRTRQFSFTHGRAAGSRPTSLSAGVRGAEQRCSRGGVWTELEDFDGLHH